MINPENVTPELENEKKGIDRYKLHQGNEYLSLQSDGHWCLYEDVKEIEEALRKSDERVCEFEKSYTIVSDLISYFIFKNGIDVQESIYIGKIIINIWNCLDRVAKNKIIYQARLIISRNSYNDDLCAIWHNIAGLGNK